MTSEAGEDADEAKTRVASFGFARRIILGLGIAAAGLVIASFHAAAPAYGRFWVPQGSGMHAMRPEELAHYGLFFVYGSAAMALLAVGLQATPIPARLVLAFRTLSKVPVALALVVAIGVGVACWTLNDKVLDGGALTDDENVYSFIAQTLRTGSVIAPPPVGVRGTDADVDFFREQFVVVTDRARFGKYPIGHPLLLAFGQTLGAERAVVPIVTGLLALLLFWIGRLAFSNGTTCLALVLFAISPQVLLTGASRLSQPASAACLLGALGCLFKVAGALDRSGARASAGTSARAWVWAAGAGALLGFGILVRPLPVALFALVAAGYLALGPRAGLRRTPGPDVWLAFLIPIAAFCLAFLAVNRLQTGDLLRTGYHLAHPEWGPSLVAGGNLSLWGLSLSSAVIRLNFWLFGFPVSLALLFFASRRPATLLMWALVGAEIVYRFLAPKAGVGTTGPIYVFEVVPLLCLLSAEGIVRLTSPRAQAGVPAFRRETAAAVLVAGVTVSAALFLPFKVADAGRSGRAQRVVFHELERQGIHSALVFHQSIVPWFTGLSWAFFPPPNPPGMDGDVLFAVFQADDPQRNVEFWKRRFPGRAAYYFGWGENGSTFLIPLEAYVASRTRAASP